MTRRPVYLLLAALALAGCGGKHQAAPATPHAAPVDVAACSQVESYIRLVSQVVSSSVEAMTQSTHPKELAARTGATQRNLSAAADALERLQLPVALDQARRQLVRGLRRFAVDFGRAGASVARGDLATAARQLVDRPALKLVSGATAKIDRVCGV
ncbi:MAG TPA: hypothetical protein VLK24_05520 [Gaiellaceae bacterium]|nr:hypothetical protein [Gaiellaceae bacterium]